MTTQETSNSETPSTENSQTPETPEAPATTEAPATFNFAEMKTFISDLVAEMVKSQLPETPKEEIKEEGEEGVKEAPKDDSDLVSLKNSIRDLMIENKGVPEELRPLIPQDLEAAKTFLSGEKYLSLKGKLELLKTPQAPSTSAPQEPTGSSEGVERGDKEEARPKTFGDYDNSRLADLLKEII